MRAVENPFFGKGLDPDLPLPSRDAEAVAQLLALCPKHTETPLILASDVARDAGVAQVYIKDERARMGLGSFKALGAAYVIARDAADVGGALDKALQGRTYVTASAGNHGMSVAAGARLFGAQAVIFLADTVPEPFAIRLRSLGAEVVRAGADYEASMAAAMARADSQGWTLLSDSSWPGYIAPATRVMEGYLQLMAEAARQVPEVPTHILVQAGVGGLAAAVAAQARAVWADAPHIIVVEPEAAPALQASIEAGHLVDTTGPSSSMGRLDCKTASIVALAGLAADANSFVTISEEEAHAGVAWLSGYGLATTPSGGAGLAALHSGGLGLPDTARVLAFLSEGPEDG